MASLSEPEVAFKKHNFAVTQVSRFSRTVTLE
jgi:hypothetical protein